MHAEDSHPEQVREVLAGILAEPEIARNTYLCFRVGRIIGEAMGLVEGEHEASERAWTQLVGDPAVMVDVIVAYAQETSALSVYDQDYIESWARGLVRALGLGSLDEREV